MRNSACTVKFVYISDFSQWKRRGLESLIYLYHSIKIFIQQSSNRTLGIIWLSAERLQHIKPRVYEMAIQ